MSEINHLLSYKCCIILSNRSLTTCSLDIWSANEKSLSFDPSLSECSHIQCLSHRERLHPRSALHREHRSSWHTSRLLYFKMSEDQLSNTPSTVIHIHTFFKKSTADTRESQREIRGYWALFSSFALLELTVFFFLVWNVLQKWTKCTKFPVMCSIYWNWCSSR